MPRQWGIVNASAAVVSASHSTAISINLGAPLEAAIGSNLHNVTVSAMRFNINLLFQATAVVGDQVNLFWGVMWATKDAIAAGALSLPEPTTDHADWIAHGQMSVVADVAAVVSMPRFGKFYVHNDSMRKQRENASSLVFIAQGQVVQDPITILLGGRVLFLGT